MAASSPTDDRTVEPATTGSAVSVHWQDLFHVAAEFIAEASAPVFLMAPFINPDILRTLLKKRPVAVVVTSWRKDHLLQGISSLETYLVARDAGAKLLVNDRLHAKLITADFRESLIGSANITAAGLGTCPRPNLEAVVRVNQSTPELKALFCRILIDGRAIDDAVYLRYVEWLNAQQVDDTIDETDEPPRIENDPFLIAQLPATRSPLALWTELNSSQGLTDDAIHDLQLFGANPSTTREAFLASLRPALRSSPFVSRLIAAIPPDGLYFGAFKALVQRTCTDVPMPHRRDLTALVQNLYGWIVDVFPDAYEVARPNYSELLRPIR